MFSASRLGRIGRALAACLFLASGRALALPTLTDPGLQVTTFVTGLSVPTTMAFLASNDILVLEKMTGRVRRVINGVLQPDPVLDLAVATDSERGLLGIAINGESPKKVFLYYTESSVDGGAATANRIVRFTWNGQALVSPQTVLTLPATPGPNHDGGVLLLGPPENGLAGDGRPLYAVIGDLNRSGQLQNHADLAAPDDTSVIFRVQQDGSPHPSNPFFGYCSVATATTCTADGGCPAGQTCQTQVRRYYAYGVRNSFGLAIDPATGALWDTENGPTSYDEVNLVLPGFNSGWNQLMGPDARDPQGLADLFQMPGGQSVYSDPEFSWLATIAPTALVFPYGSRLGPGYDGRLLVGDVNNGALYSLPLSPGRTGFDFTDIPALQDLVADSAAERDAVRIGSGFNGITDLEIGLDGSLYVVSINDGAIYRIAPPSPTPHITPRPPKPRTPTPGPTPTARATPGPPIP